MCVCVRCVCTVSQVAAQPEEAVELYLAADRPRQALAILNTQLSSVMPQAVEETATGIVSTGARRTQMYKHTLSPIPHAAGAAAQEPTSSLGYNHRAQVAAFART